MKTEGKEQTDVFGKIIVYVVVMSLFENLCAGSENENWRLLPAAVILGALLADMWRKKQKDAGIPFWDSSTPIGLLKALPLCALATVNLWNGITMRYSIGDTIIYMITMLMIGFIEEILFRGYLLNLLLKKSVRLAVLVSGLIFGAGHIVNLLNGEALLPTLLQLVYAFSVGVMLAVIMIKTKDLLACCLFHGVFNALSVFSIEEGISNGYRIVICAVITVVSLGYAWILWRKMSYEK